MKFELTNSIYDKLKFISQIVLPALGTLYFTLAMIWGLPYAKEIEGTLIAIKLCLGTILQISTSNYNKEKAEADKIFEQQNGLVDVETKEK